MSQANVEVVPKARAGIVGRLRRVILWAVLAAVLSGTVLLPLERLLLFALVGVELLIAARVLRPAGVHYLGPHFYYDLIRLARGGRTISLRILYGLLLATALFLVYAFQTGRYQPGAVLFEPGPVLGYKVMAVFAESFVVGALVMQFLGMLIITPAYIAGAIAEEREGKTLELLLTTHLTDHEIVLGKMCARLAHLGGVVLTGLPIFSLTQFWGGIDEELIVRGFVDTFLAMFIAGCLSICASARARSVSQAELASYGLVFLVFVTAFAIMAALVSWAGPRAPASASVFRDWFTLGLCGLALGTAVLCLPLACSFVRPQARPAIASLAPGRDRAPRRTGPRTVPRSGTAAAPLPAAETLAGDFQLAVPVLSRPEPSAARTQPRPAPPPVLAAETMPAEDFQLPIPVRPRREPLSALPPIKGDALLWKECNLPKTPFSPYWLSFFVLLGGSMLGLWLARSGPQGMPHLIFRSAVILLAGFVCFGVSMRAAGCIIRERHQKTLESLLLLPITAGELVARKWLGAVLYYRFYLVPLVFVLLLPVLVGVVHPIGAVLVFLAILIHVGFLVSLGMAVSAAAQKPIEAHFLLAILLVLVFAGPWWWLVLSEMQPSNRWFPVLEVGLNPVGSWNFLLFNWNDLRLDDEQVAHKLLIAAAGLCVYGAAGIGLFLATRLGFRT